MNDQVMKYVRLILNALFAVAAFAFTTIISDVKDDVVKNSQDIKELDARLKEVETSSAVIISKIDILIESDKEQRKKFDQYDENIKKFYQEYKLEKR